MSKIGKKIITIPAGVTCTVTATSVKMKGPKGELELPILPGVKADFKDNVLQFSPSRNSKQVASNWGTLRALVANALMGVTKGFEKTLILDGVGYRITKEGEGLSFTLGFSHPIKYEAVQGITFEVEKNTILKIKGFDRALVGQVAAKIRMLKKPEPYKGKGFHYIDEVIRRKAGKKAATAGATTA